MSKSLASRWPVPWLLENGGIFMLTLIIHLYLDTPNDRQNFLFHWFESFSHSLVSIDCVVLLQKFYADVIYSDIPYLNGEKRKSYIFSGSAFKEWITVHIPGRVIAAFLLTWHVFNIDEEVYLESLGHSFSPIYFIPKLLIIRIFSDLTFHIVHYIIHHRLLFSYIHKTHHEHVYTVLSTNYHFSISDLIIEGFLPFFVGLQMLTLFVNYIDFAPMYMSRLDLQLATVYALWLEIGSHTGKQVPTVTSFPPLSIIYQLFFPDYDSYNVIYHESHHNLVNYNYGISHWTDVLFGTAKINMACIPNNNNNDKNSGKNNKNK